MKMKLQQMRQYWLNLMRSTQLKLSRGAANISRIITSARGEGWRRGDNKHHHKPE